MNVDPETLKQAAEGITGIIKDLQDIGTKDTAASGRGFSQIALSQQDTGKLAVQQAFSDFADRWSWGVRTLVQSANSLAKSAGVAAGRYQQQQDTVSNALKELVADATGNPHLTTQQIDAQSWQDILTNPINQLAHPDYSSTSFDQAWQQMKLDEQKMNVAANSNVLGLPSGWHTGVMDQAAQIQANAAKK
ncbi:hypothetical protein EBN03_11795 [Nocardia stercoris]|uniref:Uncharacterized protein n=1 Tax=Nocardia stercoris TaxID=2483361 RepID=A0A3M2LD78_9NOCA|nr:hypothetical protein EBN03_11795 [Nocardia stercoris]